MAKSKRSILIVDDEPSQRALLGGVVESLGFQPTEAGSAEAALESIRQDRPAMVLLDVRLPARSGIDVLPDIRQIDANLPVLLITAYADVRQAVEAVKSGADDYLAKPVDLDELAAAIADAVGQPAGPGQSPKTDIPELPAGVVAESQAMRHVLETTAVVAPSDVPVLITGESGTGKELVARLVHQWSNRREGPLVTANSAGLPDSLIESALFGHTKGAFTGADQPRQGCFRSAHGGTLFLDEIGDMPIHLQPKLLRALESKEITPVGSDNPLEVDVRLVAATNRNLAKAVEAGTFREDLYYRLDVIELNVPPLRNRRDDILPLARHFAAEFSGRPVRLSPQAVQCLVTHNWSGNVRELRNAIQRACLLCRGDVVMPEHLPPAVASSAATVPEETDDGDRLSQVERATILATLQECNNNRTHAAKKLGISRRALIYKLRNMQTDFP